MSTTVKPPVTETAWEDSTATVLLTITEEDGVTPIPGSSLTACTFTLYDHQTKVIINTRENIDVKSKVNSSGVLTLDLGVGDNEIKSTNKKLVAECHVIQITYTATLSGIPKTLIVDFLLSVERRFDPT